MSPYTGVFRVVQVFLGQSPVVTYLDCGLIILVSFCWTCYTWAAEYPTAQWTNYIIKYLRILLKTP